MYHAVMEPPTVCDDVERDLFVSPDQFERQMADLAERGFRSVYLGQFAQEQDRTVLITFDDGYAHVPATVTQILARYEFTAVAFIPSGYLGGRNTWDTDHPNLGMLQIATPEQIRLMADGPWEIQSHALKHVDLRSVEPTARSKALIESRERLSEIVGKPVVALAYPYGYADSAVEDAARLAGYQMAFVAGPGATGNPFRLPRYAVRGTDDISVFRVKTSGWLARLHPVQRIAPSWARAAVRAAINAGGRPR